MKWQKREHTLWRPHQRAPCLVSTWCCHVTMNQQLNLSDLQHQKSIMWWGRGKKLLRRSLRASLRRWHLRRDLKDEEEGHARRGDQICKGEQTPSGFTLFPHLDLQPTPPQTNRKLEGRFVRSTQGHSGVRWILLVISRCVTNYSSGTPLAVQWLRLCTSTSGGTGSVPG